MLTLAAKEARKYVVKVSAARPIFRSIAVCHMLFRNKIYVTRWKFCEMLISLGSWKYEMNVFRDGWFTELSPSHQENTDSQGMF